MSLAGCHQLQVIPAGRIPDWALVEPVPSPDDRIDLFTPLPGDDPRYRLMDGASIVVEQQKPRYVSVGGWVQKPGRFQIKPGEEWRLMNAILEAQGVKREGFVDTVHVTRQLNTMQAPVLIKCSYKAARRGGPDNLLLTDGDVVTVEPNRLLVVLDHHRKGPPPLPHIPGF
jgi:protein involved in polysaccharide export with SLBB domain